MIEIVIWTHIAYLPVRVDSSTLALMQIDAAAKTVGQYCVTWLTDEKRMITVNWNNVAILECPVKATALE